MGTSYKSRIKLDFDLESGNIIVNNSLLYYSALRVAHKLYYAFLCVVTLFMDLLIQILNLNNGTDPFANHPRQLMADRPPLIIMN